MLDVWEIEARELAMPLLGGSVIGERGLYCRLKTPDVNFAAVQPNFGLEAAGANLLNTFWKQIGFTLSPVAHVFSMRRYSEVAPAIIEAITVDVVDLALVGRAHNQSVHVKMKPRRLPTNGCASVSATDSVPAVAGHQIGVCVINDGDKPPATKRYVSHE